MKDSAFTGAARRPGTAVTVRGRTWPGTARPGVRDGPDARTPGRLVSAARRCSRSPTRCPSLCWRSSPGPGLSPTFAAPRPSTALSPGPLRSAWTCVMAARERQRGKQHAPAPRRRKPPADCLTRGLTPRALPSKARPEAVLDALQKRMEQVGVRLHPGKTGSCTARASDAAFTSTRSSPSSGSPSEREGCGPGSERGGGLAHDGLLATERECQAGNNEGQEKDRQNALPAASETDDFSLADVERFGSA